VHSTTAPQHPRFFSAHHFWPESQQIQHQRNFMSKKNVAPGEGCNCEVMGDGSNVADHSHVSRTTPLQTKIREFAASKAELGSELGPDLNKARQSRTSNLRRAKDVRPL
jgi:hypothetical protein